VLDEDATRSDDEKEEIPDRLYSLFFWDRIFKFGEKVVALVAIVICVFFFSDALQAFAGKNTRTIFGFFTSDPVGITIAVSLSMNIVTGFWAFGERAIRKDTIERLQSRIRELETSIDPKRSSSGLTTRGDTDPGDL